MASVTILFTLTNGSTHSEDFDADGSLIGTIDDFADDLVSDANDGADDEAEDYEEIELDGWEVEGSDEDHSDQGEPSDFSDLDAWGDYCELCDEHGEAYVLRYADVGDHDFGDEYNGCWGSIEEFAEHIAEECMEIPANMSAYFDYEKFGNDLMMDYSEYDGDDGVHIFRS
jgi:antirestriction protein